MIDNKTAHLALPLPDLSNMQDEDVPRIGGALSMLDAHAQKVDSAMESQGREVAELKAGSQVQAGSLESLARALETEKAERSEADRAASTKLQELATGQNDLGQRVDTLGETSTDHGARLEAAEQGITALSTTLIGSIMSITAAEGYVPKAQSRLTLRNTRVNNSGSFTTRILWAAGCSPAPMPPLRLRWP
jgi:hypothetical protein